MMFSFRMLTKFLTILGYLINGLAFGSHLVKDLTNCGSSGLNEYGCKCYSDFDENFITSIYCQNGLLKTSCSFEQPGEYSINYFDYVIDELNFMRSTCWYEFEFTNVLSVTSKWLHFLKIYSVASKADFLISFKNLNQIEEFAFDTNRTRNLNESLNLIIKLDSFLANEDDQYNKQLILNNNCFSNIRNCKLLTLSHFYNVNQSLELKTSHFSNSRIETLFISYSNFKGISIDEIDMNTNLTNIVISYCVLNEINHNIFGTFDSLRHIRIQNSNVKLLGNNSFEFCCSNLRQLHLNNNLIKILDGKTTFDSLSKLVYLNLENNPLLQIKKHTIDPFRLKVQKLNLAFTLLARLNPWYEKMIEMRELILTNTLNLELGNIDVIIEESPSLKYLNLRNSNLLKQAKTLNNLLDRLDYLFIENTNNISFMDLTHPDVKLDLELFNSTFNRSSYCLWSNVLEKTFIQVDEDQECTCAIFYLYRNIINYEIPIERLDPTNEYEIPLNYLHPFIKLNQSNNFNEWQIVLKRMPKCYRELWMEQFSLNLIKAKEIECGLVDNFYTLADLNCTKMITTTTKLHTITTTHQLDKRISLEFTLPIVIVLLSFWSVTLVFVIFKTRYKYNNSFLRRVRQTFIESHRKETELSPITTVTSLHNMNFNYLDNESYTEEQDDELLASTAIN